MEEIQGSVTLPHLSSFRVIFCEDGIVLVRTATTSSPAEILGLLLNGPEVQVTSGSDLVPCFDEGELRRRNQAKGDAKCS